MIAVLALAAAVFVISWHAVGFDTGRFWPFFVRWLHLICATIWIGLLWYFNFVPPAVKRTVPAERKPGRSWYIAPEALFWLRWAAMGTIVLGLLLAWINGDILQALTVDAIEGFAAPQAIVIGIGMWLGIIMWFNVWFIIWPSQQTLLGLGGEGASAGNKAAAAKTARHFSRINTLLSIPMLLCMVSAQTIFASMI